MNVDTVTWQNRFDWRVALLRFSPIQWSGWLLAFALALWAVLAQGEEFRYQYVSFADKAPPGFNRFSPSPLGINNSGKVAGTASNCDELSCYDYRVAVYHKGSFTVLQPGSGGPINSSGTIGGSVELDPVNFTSQAALFRKDNVELVPPQPGEFMSFVTRLNDSGTALIDSFDSDFNKTSLLYKNGKSTVVNFGPINRHNADITGMNNDTIMSVREEFVTPGKSSSTWRGFRLNPRTGKATVLEPIKDDDSTWALGINNHGDILGYSYRTGGVEHIGVWDQNNQFKVYFVEGTSEFPTRSNGLLFNDNNLIVITEVRSGADRNNSYLVPKPGVRLNLADLVANLPPGVKLARITDINSRGDMIGYDQNYTKFLLKRTAR